MTIYSYGCTGCGITGVHIRRVQRFDPNVEVINSKYDQDALSKHAEYLVQAGLPVDNYPGIVVEGTNVTRLSAWKPL